MADVTPTNGGPDPLPTAADYASLTADQLAALIALQQQHDTLQAQVGDLREEQAAAGMTAEQKRQMSILAADLSAIKRQIQQMTGGSPDAARAFLASLVSVNGERQYRLSTGTTVTYDPTTRRFRDG